MVGVSFLISFFSPPLKNNGFEYDENYFLAQDILEKKRGNCLGLTLLIGLILEEKGLKPKYEIVLNPKDAIFNREQFIFEGLSKGEFSEVSDYNNPKLPAKQERHSDMMRFAPLEHPLIILENKKFDFTDLDVDRIGEADYDSEQQIIEAKDKLLKALSAWPDNREAYLVLRDLALSFFDDEVVKFAEERYKSYANQANDSRYFYGLYEITEKEEYLNKSLELYSSNILDLGDFYINNAKVLGALYGKDKILTILKNFKKTKAIYYIALYDLTRQIQYLQTIINKKLFFRKQPFFRAQFLLKIQDELKSNKLQIPEKDQERYNLYYGLSEKQKNSKIFQHMFNQTLKIKQS